MHSSTLETACEVCWPGFTPLQCIIDLTRVSLSVDFYNSLLSNSIEHMLTKPQQEDAHDLHDNARGAIATALRGSRGLPEEIPAGAKVVADTVLVRALSHTRQLAGLLTLPTGCRRWSDSTIQLRLRFIDGTSETGCGSTPTV